MKTLKTILSILQGILTAILIIPFVLIAAVELLLFAALYFLIHPKDTMASFKAFVTVIKASIKQIKLFAK